MGNTIVPFRDTRTHICGKDALGVDQRVEQWTFDINTDDINTRLQAFTLPTTVRIREWQLRSVLKGMSTWKLYEDLKRDVGDATDIGTVINDTLSKIDAALVNELGAGGLPAGAELVGRDVLARVGESLGTTLVGFETGKANDVMAIMKWLQSLATTHYGKTFQVRVPFTCGQYDVVSGNIVLSEFPSDRGWTEQTDIIGLGILTAGIQLFKNEDNTYSPFMKFASASLSDTSSLDDSDFYIDIITDTIWVKCQVSEDYVYIDRSTLASPRIVFTLPAALHMTQEEDRESGGIKGLVTDVATLLAAGELEKALKRVGGQDIIETMPTCVNFPDAATCGIQSNIQKYGPWSNPGMPGRTTITNDDTLVPWEFGNYATLNLAGQATADEGLTNMQVGEKGSITVAGYPDIPLGAELGAVAGGFFGAGTNLVENRTHSTDTFSSPAAVPFSATYGFFTYSGEWTGLHGPNITGINIQVGQGGLQTTYSMNSFTPKFGRLTQQNIQRLKDFSVVNNRAVQTAQKFLNKKIQLALNKERSRRTTKLGEFLDAKMAEGHPAKGPKTPNEILFGQTVPWANNRTRNIISLNPMYDAQFELVNPDEGDDDESGKAFASLDVFIRPISMDGEGGLPRYVIPKSNCQTHSSKGMQAPVYDSEGGTESYDLDIDIDFLNPFTNPHGFNRSLLATNRTDTPNMGNYIDIIGIHGVSGTIEMTINHLPYVVRL